MLRIAPRKLRGQSMCVDERNCAVSCERANLRYSFVFGKRVCLHGRQASGGGGNAAHTTAEWNRVMWDIQFGRNNRLYKFMYEIYTTIKMQENIYKKNNNK